MAWPSVRHKTAVAGGTWTPADMNAVQDQYIRTAGLTMADLGDTGIAGAFHRGVQGGTDLAVTDGAGALDTSVAAGVVFIPRTTDGIIVPHRLTVATTLAAVAGHATLPRIDFAVAAYNAGAAPTLAVRTGTATSGAQAADPGAAGYLAGAPTLAANEVLLAYFRMPAASTTIAAGDIVDARNWATVRPRALSRIAHVSAVSTYTFHGLDGNAEYGYEFVAVGATSATSDPTFYLRPNNDTTSGNYNNVVTRSIHHPSVSSSQDHFTVSIGMHLLAAYSAGGAAATHGISIRSQLHAKVIGSAYRAYTAQGGAANASNSSHTSQNCAGFWNNTTANITSLVFHMPTGTFTGVLSLRKLGEV